MGDRIVWLFTNGTKLKMWPPEKGAEYVGWLDCASSVDVLEMLCGLGAWNRFVEEDKK